MPHPWPVFDLRVRTPRLELRLPTDAELLPLIDVARAGIHDPEVMPFYEPWTDVEGEAFDRALLAFHWSSRTRLAPDDWALVLGIFVDGAPVGVQQLSARRFRALREVETGSWLGRAFQGRGLGKEARVAVLQLAFDGLGALVARSTAADTSVASIAISRALGYVDDGREAVVPRGERIDGPRFRLERDAWPPLRRDDVEIEGLDRLLPLLGAF